MDQWAQADNGRVNAWPSPSGMVGEWNASSIWAFYAPPRDVPYRAQYFGHSIVVINNGDGTYSLTWDGATSRHLYADRWKQSQFFDVQGNPVAGFDAAVTAGDPDQAGVYFAPGAVFTPEHPLSVETRPQPATTTDLHPYTVAEVSTPAQVVTVQTSSTPPVTSAPFPDDVTTPSVSLPLPGLSGIPSWGILAAIGALFFLLKRGVK